MAKYQIYRAEEQILVSEFSFNDIEDILIADHRTVFGLNTIAKGQQITHSPECKFEYSNGHLVKIVVRSKLVRPLEPEEA